MKYLYDALASEPWALQPEKLPVYAAIAKRENEAPEAVAAKLGRPLQNTRTVEMRGNAALIPVTGPIFRYANMFTQVSGATSLDILAKDFSAALEDPSIKSIVLNIDSPGGQAAGIAEFAQMVRAANKPVTAYVDGIAASAAYWIAAAANEVVISKTAMVGSIGAVIAIDTSKPTGTVEIVSSQSPNKRPDVTTDIGRAQIQARIDALAEVFIDDVAAYRGVSVDTVLADFGGGDILLGAAAVAARMADRISTLEEVLKSATGNPTMTTTNTATMNTAIQPADFETVVKQDWLADASLRREFLGFENYLNYRRATASSSVRILGGNENSAPAKMAINPGDDIDAIAKQEWSADPQLHAEFLDQFELYAAYRRAEAKSMIRVRSGRVNK